METFASLCVELRKDANCAAVGGLARSKTLSTAITQLGPCAIIDRYVPICAKIQDDIFVQYCRPSLAQVSYVEGPVDYGNFLIKLRRNYFVPTDKVFFFKPRSQLVENAALVWIIARGMLRTAARTAAADFVDAQARPVEEQHLRTAACAAFQLRRALHPLTAAHPLMLARSVKDILAAKDCVIWEKEPDLYGLKTVAGTPGMSLDLPPNNGIATEAFNGGKLLVVHDLINFTPPIARPALRVAHPTVAKERGWRRTIFCPIHYGGRRIGVLGVYYADTFRAESAELDTIRFVAACIGVALGERASRSRDETRARRTQDIIAPAIFAGLAAKNIIHNMPDYLFAVTTCIRKTLKDTALSGQARKDLELALEHTMTADAMAKKVLHIAKQKDIRVEPMPISIIFNDLRNSFASRCDAEHIKLAFEDQSGVQVNVDRALFEQALYNLIDNAIHFVCLERKKGRSIRVTAAPDGAHSALISIWDNGPGITDVNKDDVWDFWFSTRNSTGLGMGMTKRIIEDVHGGQVSIRSEHKEFTEIRVSVPLFGKS